VFVVELDIKLKLILHIITSNNIPNIYLPVQQPLSMRIISWGQQNIHVANPKKKLIIINYLK
jgi:hypothetical protein